MRKLEQGLLHFGGRGLIGKSAGYYTYDSKGEFIWAAGVEAVSKEFYWKVKHQGQTFVLKVSKDYKSVIYSNEHYDIVNHVDVGPLWKRCQYDYITYVYKGDDEFLKSLFEMEKNNHLVFYHDLPGVPILLLGKDVICQQKFALRMDHQEHPYSEFPWDIRLYKDNALYGAGNILNNWWDGYHHLEEVTYNQQENTIALKVSTPNNDRRWKDLFKNVFTNYLYKLGDNDYTVTEEKFLPEGFEKITVVKFQTAQDVLKICPIENWTPILEVFDSETLKAYGVEI